jgi:anti-sigma B factor antagonist
MEIDCITAGNTEVMRIKGRLDATNAPDLEKAMDPFIKRAPFLLINLKDLDYISSAGLRILLLGAKRMKTAGGTLTLCSLQEAVKEVFNISGFTAMFPIYDTEEAAIEGTSSP